MMSEPRRDGKITLEDVLRLKRAERPPADFWVGFERELRTRQLAAAVAKPRWWFRLPHVFTRYQMPMGAAAVLAVTFLTLREYREPGLGESFSGAAPQYVAEPMTVVEYLPADPVREVSIEPSLPAYHAYSGYAATAGTELPPVRSEPMPRSGSNSTTWTAAALVDDVGQPLMTPSARSIAANLAAIEADLPGALATNVRPVNATTAATLREPLAQLSSPQELRRERLFAYHDGGAAVVERDGVRATERIGSRISETELYDSVRRLTGGGNHLTVKF
jgi:hypothetical protein